MGIYGSNFGSTQGSSTVSFNGVPAASVSSWSSGQLFAYPPSNVTTGPITVVVNSIPSNNSVAFTVTNPAIGSLSPPAGAVGSTITLSGSGLTAQGLTTQVLFNGIAGSVTSSSSSTVTAQVPSNATTGSVILEVGTVTSNSLPFTVEQPPTITSVSPNQGPFGSSGQFVPITITGSGFGATQSNSTVNFFMSHTAPTIQNWSDSSITLLVPVDATTGPLTVGVGTYDSFGNLTASTGTITNPFRYTAREFDQETGIYFYRARYLDSTSGRFLSQDPIGFAGGVNAYRYLSNRSHKFPRSARFVPPERSLFGPRPSLVCER